MAQEKYKIIWIDREYLQISCSTFVCRIYNNQDWFSLVLINTLFQCKRNWQKLHFAAKAFEKHPVPQYQQSDF